MQKEKLFFSFSSVFKQTKEYIDTYNTAKDKLTERLSPSHRATAELLVRLWVNQLNEQAQKLDLNAACLPGLLTYNSSIASCLGCTARTVVNHRERLKQARIILKEERKGYEGLVLHLNPVLLGEVLLSTRLENGTEKRVPLSSLNTPDMKESGANVKNFLPLVHEPHEQIKITNSMVEKLASHFSNHAKERKNSFFPQEQAGTPQEHHKNMGENACLPAAQKGTATDYPDTKGEVQEQETGGAGRVFLLNLIKEFWHYAKGQLYPHSILSKPEERQILNYIWESCYGKLKNQASREEWLDYQESLFTRVNMVKKWLQKNADHWIPEADYYFNPCNEKNGFMNTWKWYIRQEVLRNQLKQEKVLRQMQKQWQEHTQGKGKWAGLSRLQLFKMQEKELLDMKDEAMMQAYYQNVPSYLSVHVR